MTLRTQEKAPLTFCFNGLKSIKRASKKSQEKALTINLKIFLYFNSNILNN